MKIPTRVRDITNQTFNFLTAIEYAGVNRHRQAIWACRCVCGVIKNVLLNQLDSGNTKSCGCKFVELQSTHGHHVGGKETPTYRCWQSMKHRCLNPNNKHWKNYGGRGIKVCDRWLEGFENFLSDMGSRPDGMSLDRIDNNGNYCKENCRWIPLVDQQSNRRNNLNVTINGITKTAAQWSKQMGFQRHLVATRVRNGWTGEHLLDPPKPQCSKSPKINSEIC